MPVQIVNDRHVYCPKCMNCSEFIELTVVRITPTMNNSPYPSSREPLRSTYQCLRCGHLLEAIDYRIDIQKQVIERIRKGDIPSNGEDT